MSSLTDVDTGTEMLLFDAWQVNIVWRSLRRRSSTTSSFTTWKGDLAWVYRDVWYMWNIKITARHKQNKCNVREHIETNKNCLFFYLPISQEFPVFLKFDFFLFPGKNIFRKNRKENSRLLVKKSGKNSIIAKSNILKIKKILIGIQRFRHFCSHFYIQLLF